jgi:predicted dehydrogenase
MSATSFIGDRVRLGVVGCGNIAKLNVPGYLEHDRCDVVAVCDPVAELAKQAAEEWDVPKAYTDLDDLLADDDVDAVEILTPTHLHHDHVVAALQAGKHVSCQKPLGNTVEECRAMAATADATGRTLRVGECFYHYPPLERAKALIAEGAIGKPTNIRIRTVVGRGRLSLDAASSLRRRIPAPPSTANWCPLRGGEPAGECS